MSSIEVPAKAVEKLWKQLDKEAEAGGYHLNPDRELTRSLIEGLIVNDRRYGYPACPCRLSFGDRREDFDIICPCDYRDPDIAEYDACYCALYVSGAVVRGERVAECIPERRPSRDERKKQQEELAGSGVSGLAYPVLRCRVCGYLCARIRPPEVCPICRATKDRFERFM